MKVIIHEDVCNHLYTLMDMVRAGRDLYYVSYNKAPILTNVKNMSLTTILEKIENDEFCPIIEIIK